MDRSERLIHKMGWEERSRLAATTITLLQSIDRTYIYSEIQYLSSGIKTCLFAVATERFKEEKYE